MKGKQDLKIAALLMVLGLSLLGCAKSKSDLSGSSLDPKVETPEGVTEPGREETPTDGGALSEFKHGSTVEFVPESIAVMSQYAMRSLDEPTNIKINVVLDNFGDGPYQNSYGKVLSGAIGGYVKIAYDDGGERVVGKFSAGDHADDATYNRWFEHNGKEVFHGFFEDAFGSVVLVIDEVLDLGDGGNQNLVSGSVWFKNHRDTNAPNPSNGCLPGFGCPNTRCWFVKDGPYECRAFVVGGYPNDEICTNSRLYPNNGYRKLGEFSGLDRAKAFAGH